MMADMGTARPDQITAVTRRNTTDFISASHVNWSGRLYEVAFLRRVWPELDSMHSTDHRLKNVCEDIRQHRINSYDCVFDDDRLLLRKGPDQVFGQFLAEMLHPVVRSDAEGKKSLVSTFNEILESDDWKIVETSQVSSHPVFQAGRHEAIKSPAAAIEIGKYERLSDPQAVREHMKGSTET